MSVFVDFLFGSSTETVPSTGFQSQQQGQEIVNGDESTGHENQDDGTATSVSDDASGNSINDTILMSSSSDTEYGDLLEGMVVGLLEVQSQENNHNDDDDRLVNDEDSASYFDGRTIVSSAPSEVTVGADPYPLEGQRRVARVPSSAAISLSTASSCFLNVEADDNTMDAASAAPSIASPREGSPIESTLSFRTTASQSMPLGDTLAIDATDSTDHTDDLSQAIREFTSTTMLQHHTAANSTAMVPSQSRAMVLRQHSNTNTHTNPTAHTNIWYAHFNDDDWDAFRHRVQDVVRSLFTPPIPSNRPTVRSYQLPPRPPPLLCHTVVSEREEFNDTQKAAADCGLPNCFLCPLCQDVMVGAITLDCGCQATVCAACWEYRCASQRGGRGQQQLALAWDYIIIPTPRRRPTLESTITIICPSCYEPVDDPLGCHALDVAISQLMVQNVHQQAPKFRSLWESYVQRVEYWRDELVRRQLEDASSSVSLSSTLDEEQRMAELIEEEESFWKGRQLQEQQKQRRARAKACELGWLGMAVAAAASVGMRLLLAQHMRAIQNGRS